MPVTDKVVVVAGRASLGRVRTRKQPWWRLQFKYSITLRGDFRTSEAAPDAIILHSVAAETLKVAVYQPQQRDRVPLRRVILEVLLSEKVTGPHSPDLTSEDNVSRGWTDHHIGTYKEWPSQFKVLFTTPAQMELLRAETPSNPLERQLGLIALLGSTSEVWPLGNFLAGTYLAEAATEAILEIFGQDIRIRSFDAADIDVIWKLHMGPLQAKIDPAVPEAPSSGATFSDGDSSYEGYESWTGYVPDWTWVGEGKGRSPQKLFMEQVVRQREPAPILTFPILASCESRTSYVPNWILVGEGKGVVSPEPEAYTLASHLEPLPPVFPHDPGFKEAQPTVWQRQPLSPVELARKEQVELGRMPPLPSVRPEWRTYPRANQPWDWREIPRDGCNGHILRAHTHFWY